VQFLSHCVTIVRLTNNTAKRNLKNYKHHETHVEVYFPPWVLSRLRGVISFGHHTLALFYQHLSHVLRSGSGF
jgi:hypothetical protein